GSNVVCPYLSRPNASIFWSYLAIQSFTVSTHCTKGSSASPTSTGIASFTFSAKLGLEHRGRRVPLLFTSPRTLLINSVRTDTKASRGSQHHQILAHFSTAMPNRVQRLRIHPPPIVPTCGHRCDRSSACDASILPSTAGWPPVPRVPTP